MSPRRAFLRYLPPLFFVGLVLVTIMALIPATSVPPAVQFWDKAQHALAYCVLAVAGCSAYPARMRQVAVGLLFHGALIEVLQATLTTTRFGDFIDWFADALGILVGVVWVLWVAPALISRMQTRS